MTKPSKCFSRNWYNRVLAPPKGKQEGDAILLGGAIQFCVNNVCLFKVCWLAANIIHKIIVVMMMSHNCFRCQCLLSTAFYWHVLLWIISFPHHLLYKIPMGLSHSPLSNIISPYVLFFLKNQIIILSLSWHSVHYIIETFTER